MVGGCRRSSPPSITTPTRGRYAAISTTCRRSARRGGGGGGGGSGGGGGQRATRNPAQARLGHRRAARALLTITQLEIASKKGNITRRGVRKKTQRRGGSHANNFKACGCNRAHTTSQNHLRFPTVAPCTDEPVAQKLPQSGSLAFCKLGCVLGSCETTNDTGPREDQALHDAIAEKPAKHFASKEPA